MKTTELVKALAPLSRMSVYRHLRALNIKPLGIRQRPQQWPEDAPEKIRARLGVSCVQRIEDRKAAVKLASMSKLRAVKKQGRAKR